MKWWERIDRGYYAILILCKNILLMSPMPYVKIFLFIHDTYFFSFIVLLTRGRREVTYLDRYWSLGTPVKSWDYTSFPSKSIRISRKKKRGKCRKMIIISPISASVDSQQPNECASTDSVYTFKTEEHTQNHYSTVTKLEIINFKFCRCRCSGLNLLHYSSN